MNHGWNKKNSENLPILNMDTHLILRNLIWIAMECL